MSKQIIDLQIKADPSQGKMKVSGSFGDATQEEVVELVANIMGCFLSYKYQDVDFEKVATLTNKFGHHLFSFLLTYKGEKRGKA